MKLRILLALLSLALAFTSASSVFAQAKLRVRADSWMPFNGAPTEEKPGYVVEIIRAIYEPEEIRVDYALCNWTEALESARAGKIEAVIGANATEAAGMILPKETVGLPRTALIVLKSSSWKYENLGSLSKIKLGVINSYSYWEALDGYITAQKDSPNVVVFDGKNPLLDGIKQLNEGKIDVMAEAVQVFIWTARTAGYPATNYRIAYTEVTEPIYVAFAKNDIGQRRADAFDAGIRKLRTSGQLASILKKYGVADWKESP